MKSLLCLWSRWVSGSAEIAIWGVLSEDLSDLRFCFPFWGVGCVLKFIFLSHLRGHCLALQFMTVLSRTVIVVWKCKDALWRCTLVLLS